MYDAVGIEHSFALFFENNIGVRGEVYDADIFRNGEPANLSILLEQFSQKLRERLAIKSIDISDPEDGTLEARLNVSINSINEIANSVRLMESIEANDYHWIIVGNLVLTISALLDLM